MGRSVGRESIFFLNSLLGGYFSVLNALKLFLLTVTKKIVNLKSDGRFENCGVGRKRQYNIFL